MLALFMRYFLVLIICIMAMPTPSSAQDITSSPICFIIRNNAEHTVYGEVATDYITTPDDQKIRHTGSFRLQPRGTTHPTEGFAQDRSEFCSSGPFYPGRQLELTIRTLVPVFSCKTSVELGEIVIHSKKVDKDGIQITKTWATCL